LEKKHTLHVLPNFLQFLALVTKKLHPMKKAQLMRISKKLVENCIPKFEGKQKKRKVAINLLHFSPTSTQT
jgi:hypothetical protein